MLIVMFSLFNDIQVKMIAEDDETKNEKIVVENLMIRTVICH